MYKNKNKYLGFIYIFTPILYLFFFDVMNTFFFILLNDILVINYIVN